MMNIWFYISALLVSYLIFSFIILMNGGDPLFFLKKRIYLLNHLGEIIKSREHRTKSGAKYFYVFAHSKIGGPNLLNDDGTIQGPSSYIKRWSYDMDELIIQGIK